jgi:isocitrate dehydrogenase
MSTGTKITKNTDGSLKVPNDPIIPFIEGDGTGPDIWRATRKVLDSAVACAYAGARQFHWHELPVGEKGHQQTGQWLPDEALAAIEDHVVAIKGPLTTPVGKGIRSLNVTSVKTRRTCMPASSGPREAPRQKSSSRSSGTK